MWTKHVTDSAVLDEAYERLHRSGPEFHGWLSNHGPMAADALFRLGHGADVQRWIPPDSVTGWTFLLAWFMTSRGSRSSRGGGRGCCPEPSPPPRTA
jgi:hypothetical protein